MIEGFEPMPVPELKDMLRMGEDDWLELNRENTTINRYRRFEQMNHVRVQGVGRRALMLFGIDANPMGEYLAGRGYTLVIREYPEPFVQYNYVEWEQQRLEQELNGRGHEVDE